MSPQICFKMLFIVLNFFLCRVVSALGTFFLIYHVTNSEWFIILYINLCLLVVKITLHSNVINLSDFTDCVYLCQNLDKRMVSQKISFLASRWESTTTKYSLRHSKKKNLWILTYISI